jgi:hypothetical protein
MQTICCTMHALPRAEYFQIYMFDVECGVLTALSMEITSRGSHSCDCDDHYSGVLTMLSMKIITIL